MALAMTRRSPKSCVMSFTWGVSPQPSQAPPQRKLKAWKRRFSHSPTWFGWWLGTGFTLLHQSKPPKGHLRGEKNPNQKNKHWANRDCEKAVHSPRLFLSWVVHKGPWPLP